MAVLFLLKVNYSVSQFLSGSRKPIYTYDAAMIHNLKSKASRTAGEHEQSQERLAFSRRLLGNLEVQKEDAQSASERNNDELEACAAALINAKQQLRAVDPTASSTIAAAASAAAPDEHLLAEHKPATADTSQDLGTIEELRSKLRAARGGNLEGRVVRGSGTNRRSESNDDDSTRPKESSSESIERKVAVEEDTNAISARPNEAVPQTTRVAELEAELKRLQDLAQNLPSQAAHGTTNGKIDIVQNVAAATSTFVDGHPLNNRYTQYMPYWNDDVAASGFLLLMFLILGFLLPSTKRPLGNGIGLHDTRKRLQVPLELLPRVLAAACAGLSLLARSMAPKQESLSSWRDPLLPFTHEVAKDHPSVDSMSSIPLHWKGFVSGEHFTRALRADLCLVLVCYTCVLLATLALDTLAAISVQNDNINALRSHALMSQSPRFSAASRSSARFKGSAAKATTSVSTRRTLCARTFQLLVVAGAVVLAMQSEIRARSSVDSYGILESSRRISNGYDTQWSNDTSSISAAISYFIIALAFACCVALETIMKPRYCAHGSHDSDEGDISNSDGGSGPSPRRSHIGPRRGVPTSGSNNSSPNSSSFDRGQSFDRIRNIGSGILYRHGSFGSAEDLGSSLDSNESGGVVQGPGFGGSFDSRTRHSDLFFSGNRAYSLAAAPTSSRSPSGLPSPLPSIQGSPTFGRNKGSRKTVQALDESGSAASQLFQGRELVVSPRLSATQDEGQSQTGLYTADFNGASNPSSDTPRSSGSMGSSSKSGAALRQRLMPSPKQIHDADSVNPFFSTGFSDGRTSPIGDASVSSMDSSSAEKLPEVDKFSPENLGVAGPNSSKAKISPAPIVSRKVFSKNEAASSPRPGLSSLYPWHS